MAGSDEARSLSAAFPAPRLRSTRPELFSPLDNGPDFDQLTGYELMARKPPGSLAARFPSSEGSIMANIWMLVTIMFGVFFYALRCPSKTLVWADRTGSRIHHYFSDVSSAGSDRSGS